jgi:hypothetical protein
MVAQALRLRPADSTRRAPAQALVELALVMPILLGIVAVLFQFGILFVAYLSIVHETRDIGRFVAVHPDTVDGLGAATCATAMAASPTTLMGQVCADTPSVVDPDSVTPLFNPACVTLSGAGHCTSRPSAQRMQVTLSYDASKIIFLPSRFRLGPWLDVAIPTTLPAYDYYVMVEPH